jgi:hypothetical protein
MKVTEPEDAQQYADLFEPPSSQAVGGARSLMARLVAHVRASCATWRPRPDRRERDRLTHSRRMLNQFETALCARFADELLNAFNRMASLERPDRAARRTRFDQIAGHGCTRR